MKQVMTAIAAAAAMGFGLVAHLPASAMQSAQLMPLSQVEPPAMYAQLVKTGHRHHGHRKFGRAVHRLLSQLPLSQAQRDQIFQIRHNAAPGMREHRMAVRAARRALHQVAFADQLDSVRLDEVLGQLAVAKANMARLKAQTNHQVFQVLDSSQRLQLQELLNR